MNGLTNIMTFAANLGISIFLVLWYVLKELPKQRENEEKNRKSEDKLAEAISGLKDKVEELQWTVGTNEKLDRKIELIELQLARHLEENKRNFKVFLMVSFEVTGYRIRDELFYIVEKNHVEENRETIIRDIETLVRIHIVQGRERTARFIIDEVVKKAVEKESDEEIEKISDEIKEIIFSKKEEKLKKRELNSLMKVKCHELFERISRRLEGE